MPDQVQGSAVRTLRCGIRGIIKPSRAELFPWRVADIMGRGACLLALGFALLLGAGAAEAQTLVGNTGQTTDSGTLAVGPSFGVTYRNAQVFSTGDNAAGYTLSEVDLEFKGQANSTVTVSIWTTASGNPGTSLYTLTNPTSVNANAVNTFTAPSGSTLSANTDYAIVVEATSVVTLARTASANEDSGKASGWSIADDRRWSADGGAWQTATDYMLQIAIKGTANSGGGPPAGTGTERPAAAPAALEALKKTLAATASRTLTSALGHIGARFGDTVPSGGLTLAGQQVNRAAPAPDAYGAHGACPPDGFGAGNGCEGWSRGAGADEFLNASAFSLALGAAEESGGGSPAMPRWSVWGQGDYAAFKGRPRGIRYDGKARTGWLGADARTGRWVAGLALSHGVTEADYSAGPAAAGRLETTLTALYPYGRWTMGEGLELRGVLGAGTGKARHKPGDGTRETSDLGMRMASAGVSKELPPVKGIDLAARADAGVVRLKTGHGPETIAGVSADNWRVRLGLEASRRFALEDGAAALTPFAEAVARRDGGDGLAGNGLEVAGGVRYSAPGVEVEARGRMLAAHAEKGAREHGMSLTARAGPGAKGRGLSLSLSPRWGAAENGAKALWREEMPQALATGNEAAMEARIGYGFAPAPGGLLTPFAETGLAGGGESRRLRLGTRFDAPRMNLGAELSGERRESAGAGPGHAVRLDLKLRF